MERHEYIAFQDAFKKIVLTGETHEELLSSLGDTQGVPSHQRLNIHYNNFRETLSDSLAGIFPALQAFVGDVFVRGALKEFCVAKPPEHASLIGYGAEFANFLKNHRVSEQLPYIADIARLEWALYSLQQVNEILYNQNNSNRFYALSENVRLIKSQFPLMSLWSVAVGQLPPEAVHLDQGGQTVAALLRNGEISLLALDKKEKEFLEHTADIEKFEQAKLTEDDNIIAHSLAQKSILMQYS